MKHVISAACDANYGDFLVGHWLKSLKDNVDLSNIDVVIFDYGLTKTHVKSLKKKGAIVKKCKKGGFPNAVKFRDMADFLSKHEYDQVMTCDGGDIIFQADISGIFEKDKESLRASCEESSIPFEDFLIAGKVSINEIRKIKETVKGKRMVNMGVLLGPSGLFIKLCREISRLLEGNCRWGSDQGAANYVLYKIGFKVLPQKYNFALTTSKEKFYIKNSVFYLKSGEKIPIVHNVGYRPYLRAVKNFGYGRRKNKLNKPMFLASKAFLKTMTLVRKGSNKIPSEIIKLKNYLK